MAVVDADRSDVFSYGAERSAWESVFSSAWYDELNEVLFALPAGIRSARRSELFAEALSVLPTDFPSVPADADQLERGKAAATRLLEELKRADATRTDEYAGH